MHETITTAAQLSDFCQHLSQATRIGFDTEFVSEDTFFPELCLLQIVTETRMAVVDPYRVEDLTPFWTTLADGKQTTVVHAAREELNFALRAIDRPPANLFDTQLAAGFCSTEYPSSYASVVTKFIGHKPAKGEQRTDWRRRPLSAAQIDYALEDVRYLLQLHDALDHQLSRRKRSDWFRQEMDDWQREIDEARNRPRWGKVSGIGNLSSRSLAIVRELWSWRQLEAERRNTPPRRVLRDDLIVELAKRKSDNPEKIRAIRGLQRSTKRHVIEELARCIRRGLRADLNELPRSRRQQMPSQLNLLGQFLSPALGSICRNANIATSLVGSASDVRELIAFQLGFGSVDDGKSPHLKRGWRAELVGNLINELLEGRKSIRIEDPHSEHPLEFDDVSSAGL